VQDQVQERRREPPSQQAIFRLNVQGPGDARAAPKKPSGGVAWPAPI